MKDNQLTGLAKYSAKKREEALIRTKLAIEKLADNQQTITIRSVAREADVSVSYIYKYPELTYKIQRLKEQQKYNLTIATKAGEKDKNKRELEQVKLKQENAELKAIIAAKKTEVDSSNELQKLKIENLELVTENLRLKQELEYTLQSLQEAREFILEQRQINSKV